MNRVLKSFKYMALGFVVLLAGVVLGHVVTSDSTASPAADEGNAGGLPIRSDGSSIFADVAERVGPAVVFIRTERSSSPEGRGDAPFDFFREFFPEGENNRRRPRTIPGGGSGFVFDDEGRILTNYHVIKDATEITVVISKDGIEEEYQATVVGHDRLTDIAIIQVDTPERLPKVVLGDSDKMRVGDWVMAIGTPFGQLQGTVTVGIVSAKGRNDLRIMGGDAIYQNYIQTDASINFGNSGGPLMNMRGEAIGINTAINPSGQGIGFAIPINMAKSIMSALIEDGRVAYGYMGIGLQELNKTLAAGRGMEIDHGILVDQVLPNTPAENAGLEPGDVIIEYDGTELRDEDRFRMMVGRTPVGKAVPLKVYRGGKIKEMDVTLVERPTQQQVAAVAPTNGDVWLGLHVDDASKTENRRRYNLERGQEGVVVMDVEEGSAGDTAGIREGDIITEVYSHEVSSLDQYVDVAKKLKKRKDPIAFLVKRGRSTTYIPVIPEKK